MSIKETYHHRRLNCGVELGALCVEGRRTTAFEIRVLAGLANEPDDKLGLTKLVEETIVKGTEAKTAQEYTDALDALGAQCGSGVGRESIVFRCSCLPEYVEQALALHAEMLRTPTFPEEFCRVSIELARQELLALEDDPGELSRRLVGPHAYGPLLGRHELGRAEALERITRDDLVAYWRRYFGAGRIQIAMAGAGDVERASAVIDRLFAGFGGVGEDGRAPFSAQFSPGMHHQPKELEQEHILMCWPGARATDDAFPVHRLAVSVLGEGMSSRLFTEVREKLGLVYWVGAWSEHPREAGMIFMGAASRIERCDQTVESMLREVNRLPGDITAEELERAKIGIIAKSQTHGDITRARAGELGGDLFHYGRPVPHEEKNEKIQRVTVEQVQQYLAEHPPNRLCVQTLGPKELKQLAS